MESPPNRAMGDEEVLEWKQAVDRENKNYFQDNPVRQTYHRWVRIEFWFAFDFNDSPVTYKHLDQLEKKAKR